MEIFTGGLARAHAGNITAVFLQIIGDLQFIKLGRHPEVREEQDHQRIQSEVPKSAFTQRGGDGMTNLRQQFRAWIRTASERSEEHTSELQSRFDLVCRLLL